MRFIVCLFSILVTSAGICQWPSISDPIPDSGEFRETPLPSDPNQEISILRFPSLVTTGFSQNDTVEAEIVLPRDRIGKIPMIVLLHYWGAADLAVEQRFAKELNRKGIGAAILTLPFHLRRAPQGSKSGEMAITSNPEDIKRNFIQSVLDARRLVDWISKQSTFDSNKIAISGVSLGAVVGAAAYAVDEKIQSAALVLGGGDIAHILFNSSLTVDIRNQFRRNNVTEEQLRAILAPVDPLNFASPEKGKNLLIIGARFDEIIPSEDTQKLITAFGQPKEIWINTGHYGGVLIERKLYQNVGEFLSAQFSGESFNPPQSIKAPTLRVGLTYNPDYEFSIAIGMDLWKPKNPNDGFVAGFITTNGPMLFGGKNLGAGFSSGITITKRSLTFGVFWGVVF